MRAAVAAEPLVQLDYAAVVDAATLALLDAVADPVAHPSAVRLLIAAQVGPVRLIDNSPLLEGADGADDAPARAADAAPAPPPTRKDPLSRCAAA